MVKTGVAQKVSPHAQDDAAEHHAERHPDQSVRKSRFWRHAWRAFARRRDPPAMRYGDGIANRPGKG